MESKCPDETLRMRRINLSILRMFEDTFSLDVAHIKRTIQLCTGFIRSAHDDGNNNVRMRVFFTVFTVIFTVIFSIQTEMSKNVRKRTF